MKHPFITKAGLFLLSCFFPSFMQGQGFLHRDGQKIVDDQGKEIILRGMGLGGYMLQEGYMFETADFARTQHEIRAKIEDLIGMARTDSFYNAYRKNYITQRDVDSMATWGFNSLRLPLHYNLFITEGEQNQFVEEGFTMVDSLLKWCENRHMYLILDLHATPGGQGNDVAISDRDASKPSLWDSPQNQEKTIILWKELARRYADKQWIGGYDLINETNWDAMKASQNKPLHDIFVRITQAIREVDKNHILFIEGNSFANDFTGLTPPWDENMAYSFHKYWNENNQASIQWVLDLRKQYNVPIWLGESGENSNNWFTNCIELAENNQIGWAFWPMKKINSNVGIMTVVKNQGYQNLLDYWSGKSPRPDENSAFTSLLQLADNYKIEKCNIHRDALYAMFWQINNKQTKPFSANVVPGIIYASDYDLGRNGYAYNDNNFQNTNMNSWGWNSGAAYRNDGVDIEKCNDEQPSNGYNITNIEAGEWINYSITAKQTDEYRLSLRIAGEKQGSVTIKNGTKVLSNKQLPATKGDQNWQSVDIATLHLQKGKNTIQLNFTQGGFKFEYLKFEKINR